MSGTSECASEVLPSIIFPVCVLVILTCRYKVPVSRILNTPPAGLTPVTVSRDLQHHRKTIHHHHHQLSGSECVFQALPCLILYLAPAAK